jgi:hypothetical protein
MKVAPKIPNQPLSIDKKGLKGVSPQEPKKAQTNRPENKGTGNTGDPSIHHSAVENLSKRKGDLSEAQLFGAAMSDTICKRVGPEAAKEFDKIFRQTKSKIRTETGQRGQVQAALESLDALTKAGTIKAECAATITKESWSLSQLDNDPKTVATRKETAKDLQSRQSGIAAFRANEVSLNAGTLPLTEVTNEMVKQHQVIATQTNKELDATKLKSVPAVSTVSKGNFGISPVYQPGFVFKPISDSTGKLAVLAPPSLTGSVKNVVMTDENGKILDRGTYGGIGNGSREHFRFQRPGGAFPPNSSVVVTLRSGEVHTVKIPDPKLRYDV